MRGLLWVLALFAVAVGVSLAAHFNDGYVLLVLPPYRIEISFNLAIVLLVAGFFAFYALWRGVALTLSLSRRVREFRERRQLEKTVETFYDLARLFFEGRYSQAMKMACAAHASGRLPALAALLAARSAHHLNKSIEQKSWLEKAVRNDPKMQIACLMVETEMYIEARYFDKAIVTLKHLHKIFGSHIAALRLELRAQQGCGHWDEVLRVARLLEKQNALQPEMANAIKLKAHQENIRSYQADLVQLQSYQNKIPLPERNSRLARSYAKALIALDAQGEACHFIETQLNKEWDSKLVALYGRIHSGELASRIACADKWLLLHRKDSQLLLALGRMCIAQRLWDKAQAYLETALSLDNRCEIRLELARMFEQIGRVDEAMTHYRAAAEQPAGGSTLDEPS